MAALFSAAPIATPAPAAEASKAPEAPPATSPGEEEASKLKHLAPAEAASVLGRPVRGPDGKDIGRIVDVLVDQAGHPRAAVIDFGGFMGVGSRKIAVDWHVLQFNPSESDKPITLGLTPDQIKATPEYKPGSTPTVVTAPAGKEGTPPAQTPPPASAAAEKPAAAPEQPPVSGSAGANTSAPPAAKP